MDKTYRRRLSALERDKIDRRVLEDTQQRRRSMGNVARITEDKWYWLRTGHYGDDDRVPQKATALFDAVDRDRGSKPRFHPARVLEIRGDQVAVGWAGYGVVEIVKPERLLRQLDGRELSDELRREPVHRDWGEIPWPDGENG